MRSFALLALTLLGCTPGRLPPVRTEARRPEASLLWESPARGVWAARRSGTQDAELYVADGNTLARRLVVTGENAITYALANDTTRVDVVGDELWVRDGADVTALARRTFEAHPLPPGVISSADGSSLALCDARETCTLFDRASGARTVTFPGGEVFVWGIDGTQPSRTVSLVGRFDTTDVVLRNGCLEGFAGGSEPRFRHCMVSPGGASYGGVQRVGDAAFAWILPPLGDAQIIRVNGIDGSALRYAIPSVPGCTGSTPTRLHITQLGGAALRIVIAFCGQVVVLNEALEPLNTFASTAWPLLLPEEAESLTDCVGGNSEERLALLDRDGHLVSETAFVGNRACPHGSDVVIITPESLHLRSGNTTSSILSTAAVQAYNGGQFDVPTHTWCYVPTGSTTTANVTCIPLRGVSALDCSVQGTPVLRDIQGERDTLVVFDAETQQVRSWDLSACQPR